MAQVQLSTESKIDDEVIERVRVTITLKEGVVTSGLDSYTIERGLLKHVGQNLITWFQQCRDTGMKTL